MDARVCSIWATEQASLALTCQRRGQYGWPEWHEASHDWKATRWEEEAHLPEASPVATWAGSGCGGCAGQRQASGSFSSI